MSKRRNILFFLPSEWDDPNTDTLVLALGRQLGKEDPPGRLLAVEVPLCLASSPWVRRERFRRWLRDRNRIKQVSENVFLYRPFVFLSPVVSPMIPPLRKANRILMRKLLGSAVERLDFPGDELSVWGTDPYHRDYLDLSKGALLVFYIWDNYRAFRVNTRSPWRSRWILRHEEAMLKKADVVITTANSLYQRALQLNPGSFCVPSGTDYEHFVQATRPPESLPNEIRACPQPIIGFVGKLNERTDFAILRQLALSHPRWSLVVVGPKEGGHLPLEAEHEYQLLRNLPNVYFTGHIQYERLPEVMAAFNVCLIPYVLSEITEAIYPRKLNEYLSTGKPIVSTDLPEVRPFSPMIAIAKDREHFVSLVEQALLEPEDAPVRRERMAIAKGNSWDNRAREMLDIIWRNERAKVPVHGPSLGFNEL